MPETHVHPFNRPLVAEFRANRGVLSGPFADANLLLLTTVGARTGRLVTSPLGYVRDGNGLLVVASAGGSPRHPAWYHNLRADPSARVELGDAAFPVHAVITEGAERDRLFALITERAPGFRDYQARTERTLPVIVLVPDSGADRARALGRELVRVHDWLRAELTRIRDEIGTTDRITSLRAHCLAFCTALTGHHTSEDTVAFPELARRRPELAAVLAELSRDHRLVEDILRRLRELLATEAIDRVRGEIDGLSAILESHFQWEERRLTDALDTLGTALPVDDLFGPAPQAGDGPRR